MTQQTVLEALRSMKRPVTSMALAAQLGRSPTTVSGILSKAAAHGRINKIPVPGQHNRFYWQAVPR